MAVGPERVPAWLAAAAVASRFYDRGYRGYRGFQGFAPFGSSVPSPEPLDPTPPGPSAPYPEPLERPNLLLSPSISKRAIRARSLVEILVNHYTCTVGVARRALNPENRRIDARNIPCAGRGLALVASAHPA